jgi:hypothetical protein
MKINFNDFVKEYKLRNEYKDRIWEMRKAEALHIMRNVFGGVALMEGALFARVCRDGKWYDLGCVGKKSVTTAFCALMVDQLQTETSVWGDFKWHQLGTGSTAENIAHTALVTPVETVTAGTQAEASSVIYQSVATLAITDTRILREHGIFNNETPASGTMLDRTMFDIVTLYSGDSYEATYKLTCTAGG